MANYPINKQWFEKHGEENLRNRFLNYLYKNERNGALAFFSILFFDFVEYIKYGFRALFGYKRHFNYYGLNPTELTDEQLAHDPVILLNGSYINQSTWFTLASALSKEETGYKGPVFTLNLNHGAYCQEDVDTIESKLDEIKALYTVDGDEVDIATHLVGFSRGAWLAYYMSRNQNNWYTTDGGGIRSKEDIENVEYRSDIGRVIMLGGGAKPHGYDSNPIIADKFRYIEGENDMVMGAIGLDDDHTVCVNSGHAGLVNHNDAHRSICGWLNEVSQYSRSDDRLEDELVVEKEKGYG